MTRASARSGRPGGGRLRRARQARGYSQQQLAVIAGVSRQAVAAVEAGLSDPSLRVAMALASALGMNTDELFGPDGPEPVVLARPVAPLGPPGSRVALGTSGASFLAAPLAGATAALAAFRPAAGLVAGPADSSGAGEQPVRPLGPPRPAVVVAGCDPALPLLEWPLSLLDPPVGFTWWPCTSAEALRLAAAGLVHAAGVHRPEHSEHGTAEPGATRAGEPAAGQVPAGSEVIGFCAWREGLLLSQRAGGISGVGDLAGAGLRLVNRPAGAEARALLDRELASAGTSGDELPGYRSAVAGHLEVAAAIAAGLADAGVASEPAALAYGLAFVPLAAERFELVIPARQARSREAQALIKALCSRWLLDQLASLPGYDAASCGRPRPVPRPGR